MISLLAMLAMLLASTPNGAPAHTAAVACTDRGGMIDPNGCPRSAMVDEGPGACPHGGRATAEQGSAIDPNGGRPPR